MATFRVEAITFEIMIVPDYTNVQLPLKQENGTTRVRDLIRKKWLLLTPEEHVRQYLLHYMTDVLQYPAGMIAVEKTLMVHGQPKRYDIAVYDRNHNPWMLVECKAPEVAITEAALHQLLQYHSTIPCPYWVLNNGQSLYCADARDVYNIQWLDALPAYDM